MSLNEAPNSKQEQIDVLKSRLNEFVSQTSISRFEADDIFELVQEGESVEWIVDQLKGDDPALDTVAVTSLLTEIKTAVGPEEPKQNETEAPAEEPSASLDEMDLSQIDLSKLGQMLPPGMKLPAGFGAQEIQNLLESPQGQIMSDFIAFCKERGIDLDEGRMDNSRIQKLQNEWQSTPREAFDGKTPAEMLAGMPGKIETYRREAPRIGRNDPCPCGSGKKYKKCCGRQ